MVFLIEQGHKRVEEVDALYHAGEVTYEEWYRQVIEIWTEITEQVSEKLKEALDPWDLTTPLPVVQAAIETIIPRLFPALAHCLTELLPLMVSWTLHFARKRGKERQKFREARPCSIVLYNTGEG